MPYRLGKQDGKYCVFNKDTGENKGCSDSRAKAVAHMRALYAVEGGAKMGKKEVDEELVMELVDQWVKEAEEAFDAEEHPQIIVQDNIFFTDGSEGITVDAIKEIAQKAVWTTAYVNNLPDSAFLYVEPGEKDGEGKTVPRSKRHFPYKDASGKVDRAHIVNAIARIPQSNAPGLTPAKKTALQNRARKIAGIKNDNKQLDDKTIMSRVIKALKQVFTGEVEGEDTYEYEEDPGQFMFYKDKESDQMRWFARYSNHFRDDDNPPEIISSQSHKTFVDMVDKGLAPYPELWLWHVPEWKFGQADWVAYDDSGFALASGTVDKGKENIAVWLSKQKDVLVSHGMPPSTIVRDETDPSVIVQHETREISPLPGWAAANRITGWVLTPPKFKQGDNAMSIPLDKRAKLVEGWGIDESWLDALEQSNASAAKQADSDGVESKEVTEQSAEQTEQLETKDETAETTEEAEPGVTITGNVETSEGAHVEGVHVDPVDMEQYPTRNEVVEAVTAVLTPMRDQIIALTEQVGALTKELSEIKQEKEDKDEEIVKAARKIPQASMAALLSRSIIGQDEAAVDGRTSLAKSKPAEAETIDTPIIGIPFLDRMVYGKQQEQD